MSAHRCDFATTLVVERPFVEGVVRRYGGRAEVEDITQEVLLSAWKHRHSFRSGAKVRTWLFRIAANKTINARQAAEGRRRRDAVGQWWGNPAGCCPFEVTFADECHKALRGTVEARGAPGQAFTARRDDDASFREISKMLGISVGTAHRHVAIVERELRNTLAGLR